MISPSDFQEKVNAFCEKVNTHTEGYNVLDIALLKQDLIALYEVLQQIEPASVHLPENQQISEEKKPTPSPSATEPVIEKEEAYKEPSISENVVEDSEDKEVEIIELVEEEKKSAAKVPNNLFDIPEMESKAEVAETKAETTAEPKQTPLEKVISTDKEAKGTVHDILIRMQQNDDMLTMLAKQQISGLSKAITINDKIEFVRELFGGDADTYKKVISTLDSVKDFDEAMHYLNTLNLDNEKPSTEKLIKLVYRRFV